MIGSSSASVPRPQPERLERRVDAVDDRAGGVGQHAVEVEQDAGRSTSASPSRWARWTASARLRTLSLRYSVLVCSLTVCGERNSRAAISGLVAPWAIRSSTSRSRPVSSAGGASSLRLEDRHAEPDHAHGAGDVARVPVLGDEARRARGARGGRRRCGRRPRSAGRGWTARPRAGARTPRRRTPRRGTGPRARRGARSGGPARSPRRRVRADRKRSTHGCSPSISRKPQWTTSWSSTTSMRSSSRVRRSLAGTVSRTRQRSVADRAEVDDAARLERLERGQAQAHRRRVARPRLRPARRR